MFDVKDKVAVITGAGGILCSEMAKVLAKNGCKVALLDIRLESAQQVADQINADNGNALAVACNVLEKASIEAAKDQILQAFGKVDILINGAGGNKPDATTSADKTFFDIPPEAIQWVFNLNFLGAVLTTQVFGKLFCEQDDGCVINISSMSADRPLTRTVSYSAAKAAISNFTQWMAVYFNQEYSKNIRVNAIAPGFLLTEQNYFLLKNKDESDTERGKNVLANTPMYRYGTPYELCGAIVWLCSSDASFVNGAIIPIDGGFSAFSGV